MVRSFLTWDALCGLSPRSVATGAPDFFPICSTAKGGEKIIASFNFGTVLSAASWLQFQKIKIKLSYDLTVGVRPFVASQEGTVFFEEGIALARPPGYRHH